MRAVLQRVSRAEVRVGGTTVGRIGPGFAVLIGVGREDSEADAAFMLRRIMGMRVFADAAGKMNLSLEQASGGLLVVSQFTLFADTASGRRPSFTAAAPAERARQLYDHFLSLARNTGVRVEAGEFGASMELELINDGPVTIILDSRSH